MFNPVLMVRDPELATVECYEDNSNNNNNNT